MGEKRKEISQYNVIKEKYEKVEKRIQGLEAENAELRRRLEGEAKRVFVGAEKVKWLERTND